MVYNGWPLYYYSGDQKPGDVKGQNFGGIWFVVSPYGGPRMPNAFVNVVTNAEFGPILTDASGRTLYLFTADGPNKTNCFENCIRRWPPFLTIGAPQAGTGASAGLLGIITREEGSTQVTYNGWPLYYYAFDDKPGDTKGQAVDEGHAGGPAGLWWVVSAAGQGVTAPLAPATLPRTGESYLPLLAFGFAALGVAAAVSGLAVRRRRTA